MRTARFFTNRIFSCLAISMAIFMTILLSSCVPLGIPEELLTEDVMRPASWTVRDISVDQEFGRGVYEYDDQGNLMSEVRTILYGSGNVDYVVTFTFEYDEDNRIAKKNRSYQEYDSEGNSSGSPYNSSNTYNYNESGKVVSVSNSSSIYSSGGPTEYAYDEEGQLIRYGEASSPSATFNWHEGLLTRRSVDSEHYRTFTYNDKNQCTLLRDYRTYGSTSYYVQAAYTYDEKGLLVRKKYYDQVHCFSYQDFTWEFGKTNYDIKDLELYNIYQYGLFSDTGIPTD
ncbi:MAG: hypothetical protein JEY99_01220 [Spirochaetales bacterium]|nr:hypothetical protein [Spirochaetales bacterium]